MQIERVHRSGKPIIVTFLSYKQKMLVLSNARKLKDSDSYNNIYVQEDFTETVQQKKKGCCLSNVR